MSFSHTPTTVAAATDPAQHASLPLLSKRSRRILIMIFILASILAFVTILIAIIRWNFAYSHYGPAVVWQWSGLFLILSAVLLSIGIVALLSWQLRRSNRAIANPEGITLLRRGRGKTIPWTNFSDLRIAIVSYGFSWWTWGTQSTISVSTLDNRNLRFRGSAGDLEHFTRMIKHFLYPLRLTEYRERMNSQQVIDFGALQFSPQGLIYRKQRIHWDSILDSQLDAGLLILRIKQGDSIKFIRIPIKNLSNPDLCAQLISNIEYAS
jgi:hypothetical protein